MNRSTLVLAAAVSAVLALPATASAAPRAAASTGWIRAAQLASGAGPTDIRLSPYQGGRSVLLPKASYGAVSAYRRVPAGLYTVAVVPAGAKASQAMVRQSVDVKPGTSSTVFATGTRNQVTARVVTDDLTPPPAGKARIRLVAAADDVPRLDASIVDGPQLTDGATVGSVTGYADVPAQTWTVQISAAGKDASASDRLVRRVTVSAGSVYTLLVLDGPDGLRLVPTRDSAGAATMPTGGVDTGGGFLALTRGVRAAVVAGRS